MLNANQKINYTFWSTRTSRRWNACVRMRPQHNLYTWDDNNRVGFICSVLQKRIGRCSLVAVYGQIEMQIRGIHAFKPGALLSHCFLHYISTSRFIGVKNVCFYAYAGVWWTNRRYAIVERSSKSFFINLNFVITCIAQKHWCWLTPCANFNLRASTRNENVNHLQCFLCETRNGNINK